MPAGEISVGSMGGAQGLWRVIAEAGFDAVVDATHPFAENISRNACAAAEKVSVPLLRLERPAWRPSGADHWISAKDYGDAVAILPDNARVFLTIGRRGLAAFMARPGLSGIARMIEPPVAKAKPGWEILLGRPPFSLQSEKALMQKHGITHLVSKNAGGSATEAKLHAARDLGLPVVMIERPPKPAAETQADPRGVLKRLEQIFALDPPFK
jgi:precorrin-6A/cobalt-precorrin-6A reductase